MPRWWQCNLAKASIRLDDRWSTRYWTEDSMYPGGPCAACGRRASIHVQGELEADDAPIGDYVEAHPVYTCGWCQPLGRFPPRPMCNASWPPRAPTPSRGVGVGAFAHNCRWAPRGGKMFCMTRWPHGPEFAKVLDCPAEDGDRHWQAWLDSHPSTAKVLDPANDVIVDVGRGGC